MPTRPALPKFASRGYKRLVAGTVGEMDHAILIEQFLDERRAGELAPHWRGGVYALDENKREHRVVLSYAVEWDDAESARQFFTAYQEVLRKSGGTLKLHRAATGRLRPGR